MQKWQDIQPGFSNKFRPMGGGFGAQKKVDDAVNQKFNIGVSSVNITQNPPNVNRSSFPTRFGPIMQNLRAY